SSDATTDEPVASVVDAGSAAANAGAAKKPTSEAQTRERVISVPPRAKEPEARLGREPSTVHSTGTEVALASTEHAAQPFEHLPREDHDGAAAGLPDVDELAVRDIVPDLDGGRGSVEESDLEPGSRAIQARRGGVGLDDVESSPPRECPRREHPHLGVHVYVLGLAHLPHACRQILA